ncbi:MAG TPA: hypothetical protein V6C95_23500 [Coleofasciculaceae cyanobacterium]
MTNWQLLFETDLVEGQDWVISTQSTALEFRLEQTLVPSLGLFAIAQIIDPVTEEYIDIKNVPAKGGNTRLVLNPLQYTTRQIGVKFRYAEWPGEPQLWHVAIYHNIDVTESANPVSIVVDVLPRIVGAEPFGAANQAKLDAIAAAQALIDAIPQPELNFEPLGAANQAKLDAIAAAQALINALTASSVGADPAGSAATAQANAIAAAQTLINALTASSVGADPAGSAATAQAAAIAYANSVLPIQFFSFWYQGKVLGGSAISPHVDSSWNFGRGWFQPNGAIGNEIQFQFIVASGTYYLYLEGAKTSDSGIQTLFIDNVNFGTIDWYASNPTFNFQWVEDISLSAGLHTFRFRVTSKNAASTGYNIRISHLLLRKP